MRIDRAFVLAGTFGLTGCLDFAVPLDATPPIARDQALLGAWRCLSANPGSTEQATTVTFSPLRDREYEIALTEDGKIPERFSAHVSAVSGRTILNVRDPDKASDEPWHLVPYSFLRPNVLRLELVNDEPLKKETADTTTPQTPPASPASKRMPDGKNWTTENLNVALDGSFCYEGTETNCREYGRLYTWKAALRACPALGEGWRLPTEDEWRALAKGYGGVWTESNDRGGAAYAALRTGGSSGFNAPLGGNRGEDGRYARREAHGFYWTASESDPGHAWFYNFGRGALGLNHHRDGEKGMAISVRCVRN